MESSTVPGKSPHPTVTIVTHDREEPPSPSQYSATVLERA